ncbi:hypothetical protein GCM10018793_62650 [Streptomyces sulfonofaciens]|uniref:IS1 family transposase n=1 Tax=Streptomyces sulfonofaciens TaxID=68272 RepID=A0A919GN98_9ACTN|nr:hypothetical protein GCM10018793_62650 [Streptomyces sulfonofaciens]
MPARILGEADRLLEAVMRRDRTTSPQAPLARPLHGGCPGGGSPGAPSFGPLLKTRLTCPSCGSSHVAQMLGDNGGISYVCTACGHSWS